MGRIFYFVKEAFRGFFQNKLMTAVAIGTVAVALFVLGCAALAAFNAQLLLKQVSERVDIAAYLQDSVAADTAAMERIAAEIREIPGVASALAVTRQDAWNRFRGAYGDRLLDAVGENPLPGSFDIRLQSAFRLPEKASAAARAIGQVSGIEQVSWSAQWYARLDRLRFWVFAGSIGLGVICLAILQFVVSNTVKLTIYARRELVVNMKFVGATDAFVRTPFVLEGILQGMAGAAIAAGLLSALRPMAGRVFLQWGPGYLIPLLFITGVVFGWSGSASAVRKFLK
jgi:cell division transport system permease protein